MYQAKTKTKKQTISAKITERDPVWSSFIRVAALFKMDTSKIQAKRITIEGMIALQ